MPSSCCVKDCTNRYNKDSLVKFYRFPLGKGSADRLHKWMIAVNRRDWQPNEGTRICSDHFITGLGSAYLNYCVLLTEFCITVVRTTMVLRFLFVLNLYITVVRSSAVKLTFNKSIAVF